MDTAVRAAVDRWLNDPAIDQVHKGEIQDLLARNDEKELTDRFYRSWSSAPAACAASSAPG